MRLVWKSRLHRDLAAAGVRRPAGGALPDCPPHALGHPHHPADLRRGVVRLRAGAGPGPCGGGGVPGPGGGGPAGVFRLCRGRRLPTKRHRRLFVGVLPMALLCGWGPAGGSSPPFCWGCAVLWCATAGGWFSSPWCSPCLCGRPSSPPRPRTGEGPGVLAAAYAAARRW